MTSKDLKNIDFIDFHTHQLSGDKGVLEVYAYNPLINKSPDTQKIFCVGLHPWNLQDVSESMYFQEVSHLSREPNCLFIGETGLDIVCKTDLDLQRDVLNKHIELARKYNKPLVLHCVRAFYDLIALRKKHNNLRPWVIHDFNGNEDIIKKMRDLNFYFSIGQRFLKKPNAKELLLKIPSDKIFFETDDSMIKIQTLYEQAFRLQSLEDFEKFKERVKENFLNLCS